MFFSIIFNLIVVFTFCNATKMHGHWTLKSSIEPKDTVQLLFALKQRNVERLEAFVRDVSDPLSENYAQYMTQQQVGDLIAPTKESQNAVAAWVMQELHVDASALEWVAHRDVLAVQVDRRVAERVFGVSYAVWQSPSGRLITRSQRTFTMPTSLAEHVELIHGLSDFSMHRRRGAARNTDTTVSTKPIDNVESVGAPSKPKFSLVDARGSPSELRLKVEMRCADGSVPTSLPMCSSNPPTSIEFKLTILNNPQIKQSFAISSNSTQQQCAAGKKAPHTIECSFAVPVPIYAPVTAIQASLLFKNQQSVDFSNPFPAVSTPSLLPQDIRSQYGIPQNARVTTYATQAVAEFESQFYSKTDLDNFFDAVGLPRYDVTVVGPNNSSNPGGEANLDIQYIMGVAPGAPTTFWSIKANGTIEIDDILKWAYAMGNATDPPLVTSISYGMSSNQVDKYLGPGYLARSDVEFAKLAAMGLTVVIASGDTGAGDLGPPPMSNPTCHTLHPDWPSQSPFVTSIGSTYFTPYAEPGCYTVLDCSRGPVGEVAVSMDNGLFWTTGGGFANTTKTAWYQEKDVRQYLESGAPFPPNHVWNRRGRAYPDFVAVGHNLMVLLNNKWTPVDGTSASAPIFSAMVTLMNDQRLRVGKAPLGLINPAFYFASRQDPETFYDVTVGNNRCGAYPGGDFPAAQTCCPQAFVATPGFDAVTGVGSPYYPKLLDFVLNLP